jgi:hypothetical protein
MATSPTAISSTAITSDAGVTMRDPLPPMDRQDVAGRRKAVIRTVLVLVAVALGFYLLAMFGSTLSNGGAAQ